MVRRLTGRRAAKVPAPVTICKCGCGKPVDWDDVSPLFQLDERSSAILVDILPYEGTPEAIFRFADCCDGLTDYWYWFMLGVLWVNYTGWSSLDLWRELFASRRPNRQQCLMKPHELREFRGMPERLTVYRAHRREEQDWVSYTLSLETARRFLESRPEGHVTEYTVRKRSVLALFLRRGEQEVLVLDRRDARRKDG